MKLKKHWENRIKKKKKNFKCDFNGCYPLFLQEWFGKYDGQTFNGQTLNLNFNTTKTRWNSGENTPQWFFWCLVNNGENIGECSTFTYNGAKYKPAQIQVRNVGATGKTRIEGVIKKKIGDGIWQNMA